MGEGVTGAPSWVEGIVAGVMALIPLGYAVWKLITHVKDSRRAQAAADSKQRVNDAKDDADEAEAIVEGARRMAIAAAQDLINQLSKTVVQQGLDIANERAERVKVQTRLEQKVDEAEQRAARCESEHSGTKANLKLIATWAKRKGMPLTPELERLIKEGGEVGSGLHFPLSSSSDPGETL